VGEMLGKIGNQLVEGEMKALRNDSRFLLANIFLYYRLTMVQTRYDMRRESQRGPGSEHKIRSDSIPVRVPQRKLLQLP
jgi:hypothetical protein